MRLWIAIGALSALSAIILGALGAHGTITDPVALRDFDIAGHYHLIHSLALIGIGLAVPHLPGRLIHLAGWLMLAGTVLFCGALYGNAFFGHHALSFTAPIGGTLLMAAWLAFALAAIRRRSE